MVTATVKGLYNERFRKCTKCHKSFETVEKVKPRDKELDEYIRYTQELEQKS